MKDVNTIIFSASQCAILVAGLHASLVSASGYHFGTQSVSAQTTANASAAEAADASTVFYNSAGTTKLPGTHLSINANLIAPSVKYSNAKGYYPGLPGSQKAISGVDNGKITDDLIPVPHLYATHQLTDRFYLGLGVYVPFASSTEYQRDSVLRYNVNKTAMEAIDINPTVAFKINDQHSISAGLIAQYISAELRQYANWGAIVNPESGNGFADGFAEIEGDDFGYGFNASYLFDANDKARFGINYRSKVEHELEGSAKWVADAPFYGTPQGQAALGAIQGPITAGGAGYIAHEKAKVKVTTPESLSVHGMVKLDDKWTAFGDVTWTRHSRFDQLDIEFETPKGVANAAAGGGTAISNVTTMKPNWKDTFKIGVGAAYQYNDKLQLRFGVAFDESPVKSADDRLTTMPDNDRLFLSLGARYEINSHSNVTLGYSYVKLKDAKANVNGWCGSQAPFGPGAQNCVSSRTNGSVDFNSHAHLLGIQYNYRF